MCGDLRVRYPRQPPWWMVLLFQVEMRPTNPRGRWLLNNYGGSAGIGISKPTIMNCIIKIILPVLRGGGFYK